MKTDRLRKPGRSRTGFTLLELLAATTMFAVIIGALYSVFHGALRMRENAYELFEEELPKSYVISLMRRDLRGAVSPGGLLAGAMIGEKEESGDVRSDRLEIYTSSGTLDAEEPWGDIQRVEYWLEEAPTLENGAERVLVRAVTRNLLALDEEEPEMEPLLRGARSLAFYYYDGEDWQDSWDGTTQEIAMPTAIRTHIDFGLPVGEERLRLPIDMVVPVSSVPVSTETESGAGSGSPAGDGEYSGGGGEGGPPGGGGAGGPR